MEKAQIKALLDKYTAGQLNEAEHTKLYDLLCQPGNEDLLEVFLEDLEENSQMPVMVDEEQVLSMFKNIVAVDKPVVEKRENTTGSGRLIAISRRWWAAASILLLVGIGIYLWKSGETPVTKENTIGKIQPSPLQDQVTLTMADGTRMVLDSVGNGVIAMQSGSSAVLNDGRLVYKENSLLVEKVLYNTLETSSAKQFQIQLPDGTKVWLNAASSLRFPTVFTGKERKVDVTGEAYFEVAKDPAKAFVVNVIDGAEVKVLGTHFNVNAYANEEQIKTTLLEGRVQISAGITSQVKRNSGIVLKPGQQAQVRKERKNNIGNAVVESSDITVINNVDLEKVVAWKNGRFNFEGLRLADVMKQLEQWYGIEVAFANGVPDIEFYGELSRASTLDEMLAALKDADVHCRLEGRKLTVIK